MNKLQTLIIVIVLGVLFTRLVVYWVVEYGKKQALKARRFEFFEQITRALIERKGDYDVIEKNIADLRAMRYDSERCDVLETEFHRQFGREYCERLLKKI